MSAYVTLADENETFIEYEYEQNISLEINQNKQYEGWVNGGAFAENDIDILDGKKFNLIIQVEVNKNGISVIEDIVFEVNVKGYKSFVTQT